MNYPDLYNGVSPASPEATAAKVALAVDAVLRSDLDTALRRAPKYLPGQTVRPRDDVASLARAALQMVGEDADKNYRKLLTRTPVGIKVSDYVDRLVADNAVLGVFRKDGKLPQTQLYLANKKIQQRFETATTARNVEEFVSNSRALLRYDLGTIIRGPGPDRARAQRALDDLKARFKSEDSHPARYGTRIGGVTIGLPTSKTAQAIIAADREGAERHLVGLLQESRKRPNDPLTELYGGFKLPNTNSNINFEAVKQRDYAAWTEMTKNVGTSPTGPGSASGYATSRQEQATSPGPADRGRRTVSRHSNPASPLAARSVSPGSRPAFTAGTGARSGSRPTPAPLPQRSATPAAATPGGR